MSAEIVITRDWGEVRKAMAVVHDTFCEAGFLDPRPSGLRMIPNYLNPGTTLILGMMDGEPAAATAVIPDGPFGLPSDRAFVEEIDGVRGGGPLFEVGSLGILPWARRHSRDLITMAFAATLRLLRESGQSSRILCSVEPTAVRYYDSSFGVVPLCDQERPLYGAAAALISARVSEMEEALRTRGGAHRSKVLALADDPDPDWLIDRRPSTEWPAVELGRLLLEAGAIDRLKAQLELAAPALQAVASGEADRSLAVRRRVPAAPASSRRQRRFGRNGAPRPLRVVGSSGPPAVAVPPGTHAIGA